MKRNTSVSEKKTDPNRRKERRKLKLRRWIAFICFFAAFALAYLALLTLPRLSAVIWGISAVALLLLSLMLYPKRGLPVGVYLVTGALCVGLVLLGWTGMNYVPTDSGYLPSEAFLTELTVTDAWPSWFPAMQDLQSLYMRGSTVTDFSPLLGKTSLRTLDIRENYAFNEDSYEDVSAALPDCDILWSVPAGDGYFDSTGSNVDLTGLNISNAEIEALIEHWPDKDFDYLVSIQGRRIPRDAETVDLAGITAIDPDEIVAALALLPNASAVDLRGTPLSADEIRPLWNLNGLRFMFSCRVPEGEMTTEDSAVTIPSGDFDDLQVWMSFIEFMPNLDTMDARAIPLTSDDLAALRTDSRTEKLIVNLTAFGKNIDSLATELNLDGIQMSSTQAVEDVLALLPRITRVSMCECGLSDDDMAELCDRHPDIKFVFIIHFGHYTLRTDATAFTTGLSDGNTYGYDSSTFRMLQYCTDLMMLDIGHCKLTNISALAKLTKLRVLILADNLIKDISPLAGLEDLEYVELFLNNISDLTPLANKQHLMDLNLHYNPLGRGDYSAIFTLPALERLWIGSCDLTNAQLREIKNQLPNVLIRTGGPGSTAQGWRTHKRYAVIKEMYEKGEYIPFS